MPDDKYMDREVASVAGLKYVNRGQARKQAAKESQAAQAPAKKAQKRGSKR